MRYYIALFLCLSCIALSLKVPVRPIKYGPYPLSTNVNLPYILCEYSCTNCILQVFATTNFTNWYLKTNVTLKGYFTIKKELPFEFYIARFTNDIYGTISDWNIKQ